MSEIDNSKLDINKIVGGAFEDMSMAEMMQVQGSGEVQSRTSTPVCTFFATYASAIGLVKSIKGNC